MQANAAEICQINFKLCFVNDAVMQPQTGIINFNFCYIDSTHVPITAPSHYEADYVNRKSIHSMNVQVHLD